MQKLISIGNIKILYIYKSAKYFDKLNQGTKRFVKMYHYVHIYVLLLLLLLITTTV